MNKFTLVGALAVLALTSEAQAATFTLNLQGQVANFTQQTLYCCGLTFDAHFLNLTGLDSNNAITVNQGDMINATVTLDQSLTIPTSQVRTDFLLFVNGNNLPSNNTGVSGTFVLFSGATQIATYNYSSSTSGGLASFAALYPPDNNSFTFTSFTDNFTIDTLAQASVLDRSSFEYSLDSLTVPEPAAWALMVIGVGLSGASLRRQRKPLTV